MPYTSRDELPDKNIYITAEVLANIVIEAQNMAFAL